ncbi:MAG: helix-turn-helix domain-containing protein [Pseudomonadota bacterium]
MKQTILTAKEVAKYLKLTERTIYRLVQEGGIPAFKVGGSWRFVQAEIDSWIRSQSKKSRPSPSARKN